MKITHVKSDAYWEGLYINGSLVTESHKLTADDVLSTIQSCQDGTPIEVKTIYALASWLEDVGSLPPTEDEVVLA